MPGAARLGHELEHSAVGKNEVMSGDLGDWIAEPLQRFALVRHARVVQDQHGRAPAVAPLAMVRRWEDLGGDGAVRGEALRHGYARPADRLQARCGVMAYLMPRSAAIRSQAALIAASRSVAILMASGGRPRAISRSG